MTTTKKTTKKKTTKKKVVAKPKPAASAKPKKQKVYEAWAELLSANEKATKANKLTDEQLVKEMQKRFPDRSESTTITRITMARGCFNKGTNMFTKLGAAATTSKRYDENGEAADRRAKVSKKKVTKKKGAAKRKVAKKKVPKKK